MRASSPTASWKYETQTGIVLVVPRPRVHVVENKSSIKYVAVKPNGYKHPIETLMLQIGGMLGEVSCVQVQFGSGHTGVILASTFKHLAPDNICNYYVPSEYIYLVQSSL